MALLTYASGLKMLLAVLTFRESLLAEVRTACLSLRKCCLLLEYRLRLSRQLYSTLTVPSALVGSDVRLLMLRVAMCVRFLFVVLILTLLVGLRVVVLVCMMVEVRSGTVPAVSLFLTEVTMELGMSLEMGVEMNAVLHRFPLL